MSVTAKRSSVALTCVSFPVSCNNYGLQLAIVSVGPVLRFNFEWNIHLVKVSVKVLRYHMFDHNLMTCSTKRF